jgi:alkylhydroperoxidase family enzyme
LARDIVAGKNDLRGSSREKALAGFARVLTDIPWGVTTDDIDHLRKEGLSEGAITQTIFVVAFFNYYPRVADGVGIEFDYESPLPRIEVDKNREPLPRLPSEAWNSAIDGSTLPVFPDAPQATKMLEPWRQMHFDRTEPLTPATRRLIAKTVAEELCDAGALGSWKDAEAENELDKFLVAFARKLTRTPWAMDANDAQTLRAAGLSDVAILGAITLIAHQNGISRLHHGLAAMRR